jgi:hypothetical protein
MTTPNGTAGYPMSQSTATQVVSSPNGAQQYELISAASTNGQGTNSISFSNPKLIVSGSTLYNIKNNVKYTGSLTYTLYDTTLGGAIN